MKKNIPEILLYFSSPQLQSPMSHLNLLLDPQMSFTGKQLYYSSTSYNVDNVVRNGETLPRITLPRTMVPCTTFIKSVLRGSGLVERSRTQPRRTLPRTTVPCTPLKKFFLRGWPRRTDFFSGVRGLPHRTVYFERCTRPAS